MAKAYGYIIVYNNNGDIVYQHKGSGGDYGGTVSFNNNIVTISSDYAPQVEPIDDSDPEFPDRWSTVIDTGEVNVSNLTNPTSLQIVLPYKASKIRYFGGGFGNFADSAGSDYADIIINNGETITLASNNYASGGGCAIQYYEPQPTLTFKHFFDAGTIGSGTVKFRHYSQQEPTPPTPAYTDCLTFTGKENEFTLAATNKTWDGTLEWSTDHNTWTTLVDVEEMQSVDKKLYLRGKNTTFYDSENALGVEWTLSDKADCIGNIQTLLDWENPPTSISVNYCYCDMFSYTSLTSAPELPATTLTEGCYRNMFGNCYDLTAAPKLPATTLADDCYYEMFISCENLTIAPKLPATTLASSCYNSMFKDCKSLTIVPELPATTLASYCYYYMFNGCVNLTTTPKLPATTLALSCYEGMFWGANLTTVPDLPATTLASYCYKEMFRQVNLPSAPILPATTLKPHCYDSMFFGSKLTTAPALPATTLATDCYNAMFMSCRHLISATNLPATTLEPRCYSNMFCDCPNLKINTSSGNKIFTCPSTIPTGAVTGMFAVFSGGSYTGGTPTAGTTYYYTE